jgi:DNA-binding MurR/RpiR family transcriptional regulator
MVEAATSPSTAAPEQLMKRIAGAYDELSRQQKVVAKYFEDNHGRIAVDRISEIAARCEVQPSAIVRFAQRFGFSGFSEMQAVFREAFDAGAQTRSPNYQQRIRSIIKGKPGRVTAVSIARESIDNSRTGLDNLAIDLDDAQFEAAVQLLLKAENIYVIGVRRSFPIASYIVYALQHTRKRVHLVSTLGGMLREQVRSIRDKDVIVAISFAPYGKETQYAVRAALHHGARSLVITDSQMSPLARNCSALLLAREGSAFGFRSLTSTMCLCQALFIALAYRLELNLEEGREAEEFDV